MEKNETPVTNTSQPIELEELRKQRKTPEAVFRGVCAANGWSPGRAVDVSEYDKAVAEFGVSSIAGGQNKC